MKWSDREIAKRCRVHNLFVSRLRPEVAPPKSLLPSNSERTYTTKHGTVTTMKTSAINADRPKRGAMCHLPVLHR